MLKQTIFVTAILAAAIVPALPTHAETAPPSARTERISLAGVDLLRAENRIEVRRQVRRAIKRVCSADTSDLTSTLLRRSCERRARAEAGVQLANAFDAAARIPTRMAGR